MAPSATTNPRSSMVTPASAVTSPSVRDAGPPTHYGVDTQLLAVAEGDEGATGCRGSVAWSVTPALTSILRFLNERATVRTTSSSHPLRMVGRARRW